MDKFGPQVPLQRVGGQHISLFGYSRAIFSNIKEDPGDKDHCFHPHGWDFWIIFLFWIKVVQDDSQTFFLNRGSAKYHARIFTEIKVGRLYRTDFKTVQCCINFYLQAYLGFNQMITDFLGIVFYTNY